MTNMIQVMTTTGNREDAQRIAEDLVSQHLAAAVQVSGPSTSCYWWKGKMTQAEEWVCRIKTRSECYQKLESAILAIHPYEVPEILALPVVASHHDYAKWLSEVTQQPD